MSPAPPPSSLDPTRDPAQDAARGPDLTAHLIPHQHFDHAWYVPIAGCNEVAVKNLRDALLIMRRDPTYTFVLDQGVLLRAFLDTYPDMRGELQQRVAEGRLGLACGMMTMPDAVLPCGEAHVRNLLHGKQYFYSVLHEDVVDGWMLDVFGQTTQLPQLFAGARIRSTTFFRGFDYRRPYVLDFRWRAPDGSEIMAHVFPGTKFQIGYTQFIAPMSALGLIFCAADRARIGLYMFLFMVQTLLPTEILRAYVATWHKVLRNARVSPLPHVMVMQGSDFARPLPTLPFIVKCVRHLARDKFRLRFSTPGQYFDAVTPYRDQMPVMEGEFMAPYSILQGTYSTRAFTKTLKRRLEHRLYEAEVWACVARQLLGTPYPRETIRAAWGCSHENDFHDIICGCNSDAVYLESTRDMKHHLGRLDPLIERLVREMRAASLSRETGTDSSPFLVWACNPLPWTVTAPLEVPLPGALRSVVEPGKVFRLTPETPNPAWITGEGNALAKDHHAPVGAAHVTRANRLRLVTRALPGIGWTTFRATPVPAAGAGTDTGAGVNVDADDPFYLHATEDPETGTVTLENATYRLRFETRPAVAWRECLDKRAGVNLVPPGEARFGRVRVDKEIGDTYFTVIRGYRPRRPKSVRLELASTGPLAATVKITERYKKWRKESVVVTCVTLHAGIARVDVDVRVTNRFKRVVYRLALPLNLQAHTVTCRTGVPAGFTERPYGRSPVVRWLTMEGQPAASPDGKEQITETEMEAARDTGAASARRIGVAILDEGIPARETRGSVTYLTLLRSVGVLGKILFMPFAAAFPYNARGAYERGTYAFRCALASRAGGFPPARAARLGWEFNVRPRAVVVPPAEVRPGSPPESSPQAPLPVSSGPLLAFPPACENFVMMGLKPAERRVVANRSVGQGLVCRVLETSGEPAPEPLTVTVAPALGVQAVRQVNLLEEPLPTDLVPGSPPVTPLEWDGVRLALASRPQAVHSFALAMETGDVGDAGEAGDARNAGNDAPAPTASTTDSGA